MNQPLSPEALDVALKALVITAQGMTGIFIFMVMLWGVIVALDRWFGEPSETNET